MEIKDSINLIDGTIPFVYFLIDSISVGIMWDVCFFVLLVKQCDVKLVDIPRVWNLVLIYIGLVLCCK